jgi:hypothetical protein
MMEIAAIRLRQLSVPTSTQCVLAKFKTKFEKSRVSSFLFLLSGDLRQFTLPILGFFDPVNAHPWHGQGWHQS